MNILIADDHTFTLYGTTKFVKDLGYSIITSCNTGDKAWEIIQSEEPDIAILDISMPKMDGLAILERVFDKQLNTKVILLTMHKELSLYKKAMEHDVYGYLLKEHALDELEKCLKEVASGNRYLSQSLQSELKASSSELENGLQKLSVAEKKIIELIGQHKTSKQIADLLFISEKTVEGHRANIIRKLNLPKEKNSLLVWASKNYLNKGE